MDDAAKAHEVSSRVYAAIRRSMYQGNTHVEAIVRVRGLDGPEDLQKLTVRCRCSVFR